MAKRENLEASRVCINDALTDDELRAIFEKLQSYSDKDTYSLVCKRWLMVQSTERKKLCARAGPLMLKKMAARFSRVVELDLSQSVSRSFYPGVTDSDLSVIANGFGCLQILNLQNCKSITDAGMKELGKGLPNLQSLDASHCRKLTDKGMTAIAEGCHYLRSLHLSGCKSISDGLLKALSRHCCHLEELGLQSCINITDSGISDLVDGCHQIKSLDINKCTNVGDIGISRVSGACSSSLKTLKLLDCYKAGDESVFSLAESCKDLETLIIGGCRNVTDESIRALVLACNNLKNLQMDWCLNISDLSLTCVFSHCKNLEILDIGCCDKITDMGFHGLTNEGFGSSLKVLKASNCPRITVLAIGLLLKFCESLEYLDVRCCPHISKQACDQVGLQFPELCKVNFTGSQLLQVHQ